ncbi:conserved Plasmodium protein, unknown function [Plasmodium yoelii]|uniref:Protein KIC10 n=2 Tax=Plasmodium yoelii TaxID=5861 RepID=A0AAE9WVV2_PLAYO|nr:conserved Plasmodium protein, unknown function [Plasmodium yoelii]WBY57398.1 protein KIC10 [Plasmodium yoelii yoelii]CDU18050.1 conserved Plasmodium protein, unknown function [Plasmodium yoelii]VTZ78467.1 conserved Plasmodium protein, unknown function [Plasmodium yoelii]|eukprot:XP_022812216.1 conserved Plasmodium protein, unknown function [Plasmodium yoelii]
MQNFVNSSNININNVSSQSCNILGQNIEEGNQNNKKNGNIQYNANCTYTTSLENEYLVKQNTVKNIPEVNQDIQKEVTIKDTSDDIHPPYTTNYFLSKENMSKYFSNNDNEFNTNKNLQDAVNRRKQIREMILSNNSLNLSLSSHNFEQIDIKEHTSEQNFTNIPKQMLNQYNITNKDSNSRNDENGVRRDYNGKNDCTINNQNNIYGEINNYNSNLHNNNNNINTGNIGIPLHKLVSNDNGNENDIDDYKTFLTLDSNQTIFKTKPLKVPDISFLHSTSKSYSGNNFNNPYENERKIEYNVEGNNNNDNNNYNFTRNKILYEKLDGLSFYCDDDDDNKIIFPPRQNYQSSTLQKLTGMLNYNNNNIVDKSALDRSMSYFDLRREKKNDIVKNYIKINKVRNGNIRNEDNATNNIFNNYIHKDENRKIYVHGENDLNNVDMHRNAFDHDYNKNYDTMHNIRRSTNIIDNLVHNRLVYNNNHIFNNNENINILNKITNPDTVYPLDFRSNNTHDGICNNIGKYDRYNNFNYKTIDNKYIYDKNNFMHENENYVNFSYIKNIEKFKELLINIATDNLKEYVKCLQNINEQNLNQYKDNIMQVNNYNINHFINEAFKVSNPVKNIKESILNNSDTFSSLHKSTNESDELSTTTHDDDNSSNSDLINLTESRHNHNSCIHISCNDADSSADDCKNNSKYCSKKNVKYANELAYVSTNKSRKCRKLKNRLNLSLVDRSKTNKSGKNCDNNHTKNVRNKDSNSKNIKSNSHNNLEIIGNLNDIKEEERKKKKSYNIPNKKKNNVGNNYHNSDYPNSCKNCCKKAQVINYSPQKDKKKNSCNSNKKCVLHNSKNSQKYNFSFNTDSEDYNDNDNNESLYISQNDSDKNNYEELNTKENPTTSSDKNACKCNDTHEDENKKEYSSKNYSDIDAYISNEDIKENKNDKCYKEYNHKDKYDVDKDPPNLHTHSHTRQASNKQISNANLMKRSNSEKILGIQKDPNIDNKTENTIHNKYINCNINKSLDYCENINSNDKLNKIKNTNENNINCNLKRESNYNFDGILNKDHENISNSNDDVLNFQANSKDNKKHLKNEMDISNNTQDDNYNYKQSIDINPNTIENIRDLIKNNKTRVENLYANESSQDDLCINKNVNELKYRMEENKKGMSLNEFNNTSNLDNEHSYSINSYNDETENRNIIQCSLDSFNDEFYNSVTIPTPAESILSKSSLCSSHNENELKKNNFDCRDSQSANGEKIDHSLPSEKENSFITKCKMEMKVHRNGLLNDTNSSSNNGDNPNNIYINKKEILGKYTYSEFSLNTKQNISNSTATNNINNVDRKLINKNTNLIVDEVYKELFQQKNNIFPEINNSSEIISNTSHMTNLMVDGLGNNSIWYSNDNSSYNNELGEKNKNIIHKIVNTIEIKEMKTKTKQGIFEITPNGEVMFTFLGRSEIMKYKNVQNKKYVNIDISKPRKLLFIIDVGGVNIKIKDILLDIILDFYNIFEEELPQSHKVRYTYAYDVVEAFKKHTPKISLTKKWLGIYNLMSNGNAPDFIATLKNNMFIDKIEIKNNYVTFILKDKNTINLHIDDLNQVTTQFTKSMMNNKNGNIHQPNMSQSNINLTGIEGQNEHVKNIMMNLQVLLKKAGISIDIIIQNWCNTLQAYSHCLGLLTKGNAQYALKLRKTLSNISGNPEFHKRNVYFSIFPIFVDE